MQTMFDKAPEGTILHQIYVQNLLPYDDPFFRDFMEAMQLVLNDPDRAFLYPSVIHVKF